MLPYQNNNNKPNGNSAANGYIFDNIVFIRYQWEQTDKSIKLVVK